MQLKAKSASAIAAGAESAATYERKARERKTQALNLETAEVLREEQRRATYAVIDSNASKWRYSVKG